MTFEEAIRMSIKSYFKEGSFSEMNKVSKGKIKFDKKYFDKFEEEQFGTSPTTWNTIKETL